MLLPLLGRPSALRLDFPSGSDSPVCIRTGRTAQNKRHIEGFPYTTGPECKDKHPDTFGTICRKLLSTLPCRIFFYLRELDTMYLSRRYQSSRFTTSWRNVLILECHLLTSVPIPTEPVLSRWDFHLK
jgi:hypothetical protein